MLKFLRSNKIQKVFNFIKGLLGGASIRNLHK